MESELSTQAQAKGAAMNSIIAETLQTRYNQEKLEHLYQQASTHNTLLEINRSKRQRQQLERRQAWHALRLAITTLIRLELSGKHARA
jgi:DNA-binding transcriptional regulator YbjK